MSAQNGHLNVMKALPNAGGREPRMLPTNGGFNFLHVSSYHAHREVVKFLIQVGELELLMMQTTHDGLSCLYAPAQEGPVDTVKALLEAGVRDLAILTEEKSIVYLYSIQ
jgi:ankyrin repeat protein